MKRRTFIGYTSAGTAGITFLGMSGSMGCLGQNARADYNHLKKWFLNPPDQAKPSCFWWWFNSLVDKECITRDLQEFKAKGMGGVTLICSGNDYGVKEMPRGPVFLSAGWRELFRHAVQEADRLGLDVGVNFCGGGWDMGGAWIKPEYSSRWYVQSQLTVNGPLKFSGPLPLPGYRDGYDPPHFGNVNHYMTWPEEKADYRDTAVIAFPDPEDGGADLDKERRAHLAAKSNRKDGDCFLPALAAMGQTLIPWKALPDDKPIRPGQVIDLTSMIRPGGVLDWEVPEGRWTILRTGHVLIGCDVRCVLPEVGYVLEVDWLNPAAVDEMFTYFGNILLEDAGPLAGKTLKYFHTDSFEDGFPNWTGRILEQFIIYRGYDPTAYLPVLAGKIVGNAEISDRFLYDYRKTVADCMADGNYGRFAERSKQHGLEIQCEAAGPSWSGTVCMDGLKNLGRCEMPMGEFWLGGTFVVNGQNKVGKQTASAAHIYGRRTASAESFTSFMHWQETPGMLKHIADRAFCEGINRLVFHTMTCQRPQDGKPGFEYGAGTHFSPNITWWDQVAGPWLSYVNRCQALLQSGLFVADVLYYNGDWAPNLVEPKHVDPSLGKGYDYDVCNAEVLLTRLSVKKGRLMLPDGMSYHLLVLPESRRMPVEVLRKIRDLVQAGATVVGPKPESDPGLRNFPLCDDEVKTIADKLWGPCDGVHVTQISFGKGRIIRGKQLRQVLQEQGVMPDFEHSGSPETFIDFIHRTEDETGIYFLANRNNTREIVECTFRQYDRQPELWDPVSGTVRKNVIFNRVDGRITMRLEFMPHGSIFVIFGNHSRMKSAGSEGNFFNLHPVQEITGPWRIQFDPQWFYPVTGSGDLAAGLVTFAKLEDWSRHPEHPVKYFSGTARYKTTFGYTLQDRKARIFLELGEIANCTVRVHLNGIDLGVLWCPPWHVDITDVVENSENRLEIEVVSPWSNRVVGDLALPATERRTRTNVIIDKNTPLLPSGLLGPLTISIAADRKKIDNYPSLMLSNGILDALVFLPDRDKGYYRSVRFDWSGMMAQVSYKGHTFFQDWSEMDSPMPGKHDPLNTASGTGIAEEFREPLGYEDAAVGQPFLKIGVGLLEKEDDKPYFFARPYKILQPGEWEITHGRDWILFEQSMTTGFGYAYRYSKRISLISGKPEINVSHVLDNTGTKNIFSNPYCHNFFRFDQENAGPDYTFRFPNAIKAIDSFKDKANISGDSFRLLNKLTGAGPVAGAVHVGKQNEFIVSNSKTGTSVYVDGDQPLSSFFIYIWSPALCPEPMIDINIEPGGKQEWTNRYRFKAE